MLSVKSKRINFTIGKNTWNISELTDFPNEWLDNMIFGLQTIHPFVVYANCDPGRLMCLVSYWNSHIIYESELNRQLIKNEDVFHEIVHISMIQFCKQLYEDFNNDISSFIQLFDNIDEKKYLYNFE